MINLENISCKIAEDCVHAKECFLKGFIIGRRISVKSMLKNGEMRYDFKDNSESFYWKNKFIVKFSIVFEGGEFK